ncbi:MAG: type II secretion system protein GspM [Rhodobacteraceae bacterium]|nr:type II secretion system protein GspM [Paracoccaceae bacterium]
MNSAISKPRRFFLLTMLALFMGIVWFGVLQPTKAAFAKLDGSIQAELATQARVQSTIAQLRAEPDTLVAPDGLFWVGESKNLLQATFQEKISAVAMANDIRFNSVTPISKGDVSGYGTVSLRAEGETDYRQIISFLDQTLKQDPSIAISALNLRNLPNRQNSTDIRVSFQITLWAVIDMAGTE